MEPQHAKLLVKRVSGANIHLKLYISEPRPAVDKSRLAVIPSSQRGLRRVEMSRALRSTFFDQFAGQKSAFPELVYSKRPVAEVTNRITVVLNFDWPVEEGRTGEYKVSPSSSAAQPIMTAILRLQGALEWALGFEVELLDIQPGCVRVRFSLPEALDTLAVLNAIARVYDERDALSIMTITGHVGGRAVTL